MELASNHYRFNSFLQGQLDDMGVCMANSLKGSVLRENIGVLDCTKRTTVQQEEHNNYCSTALYKNCSQ